MRKHRDNRNILQIRSRPIKTHTQSKSRLMDLESDENRTKWLLHLSSCTLKLPRLCTVQKISTLLLLARYLDWASKLKMKQHRKKQTQNCSRLTKIIIRGPAKFKKKRSRLSIGKIINLNKLVKIRIKISSSYFRMSTSFWHRFWHKVSLRARHQVSLWNPVRTRLRTSSWIKVKLKRWPLLSLIDGQSSFAKSFTFSSRVVFRQSLSQLRHKANHWLAGQNLQKLSLSRRLKSRWRSISIHRKKT